MCPISIRITAHLDHYKDSYHVDMDPGAGVTIISFQQDVSHPYHHVHHQGSLLS